jgi:uncharacterized protein YxjI
VKSFYLREYTKNLLRWRSITDSDHRECYVIRPQLLKGLSLFLMDTAGTELAQITPDFWPSRTMTYDISQDGVHAATFQMKMGFEYEGLVTVGESHWAITGNTTGSQYDIADTARGIIARIRHTGLSASSERSSDVLVHTDIGEDETTGGDSGFLGSLGFGWSGDPADTHSFFPTNFWIDIEDGEPEILLFCVAFCFRASQNYQRLPTRFGPRKQPQDRRR